MVIIALIPINTNANIQPYKQNFTSIESFEISPSCNKVIVKFMFIIANDKAIRNTVVTMCKIPLSLRFNDKYKLKMLTIRNTAVTTA